MSGDDIAAAVLREVAMACDVSAEAIKGHDYSTKVVRARHLWWYLLAVTMPAETYFPTRAGGRRPSRDGDGQVGATARLVGRPRAGVRYGLRMTEERRDDPEFDALVAALEAKFLTKEPTT